MIKRILVSVYLKFRVLAWSICAFLYRFRVKRTITPGISYKRILILAPHSDDEWIGCGNIVNEDIDVAVCNMNKSGGDTQKVHNIRTAEMIKICQLHGKQYLSITDNNYIELKNEIIRFKPEAIMLPFFYDWHEEHQQVINTLSKVVNESIECFDNIAIGMYQVSVPIKLTAVTHCMKMSKAEFRYKWKKFREVYASQAHIPYNRFAAYERINGALCNSYAAEVFVFMSARTWKEKKAFLTPNKDEIKNMKSNLNSIHTTFSFVNKNERIN